MKFHSRLFSASINRLDLLAMVLVMAVKKKNCEEKRFVRYAIPKMVYETEVGFDSSCHRIQRTHGSQCVYFSCTSFDIF